MYKLIIGILLICFFFATWHITGEIYRDQAQEAAQVSFTIEPGESVNALAERLEEQRVIRSSFWFKQYLKWKELDTQVRAGNFMVEAPITVKRVAESLSRPAQNEREITILPGWTLQDIASYLEAEGFGTVAEVYTYLGVPAERGTEPKLSFDTPLKVLRDKPAGISLEGYLRPDTFRVFADSTLEEVLQKLVRERDKQLTPDLIEVIDASGRTIHEVMTVASLLEKEVRGAADKVVAADVFWKRYDAGWAMQADSSIHYIHGRSGSVFTTPEMRASLNPYNTYKYPGLPPGPISTPSMTAIEAAIYPEESPYWYFITTLDTGEAIFARDLDEHNRNVQMYLR